jgi:lipopolysaccharide biosynthesis regulator YciM
VSISAEEESPPYHEDPSPESDAPTRDNYQTISEQTIGDAGPGESVLEDPEELEKWRVRAAFLEAEARASVDRAVKARGLLVASELFALSGDEVHAHELAIESRDLGPTHPLPHRQARALSVREGDWTAVTLALQGESRSASTPAARVHGALFSAEIARLALSDKELAQKRFDQAMRAAPADVRAYVSRLAAAIGDGEALPKLRWPEGPELAPLTEAAATLARWRGASDRSQVFSNPVDALLRARASVRARDPAFAIQALESLAETAGLADGAGWLTAALALAHASNDEAAAARLAQLAKGRHAAVARRAIVARALEKGRGDEAIAAMGDADDATFAPKDRAVIGTLAQADAGALEKWLAPLDRDPEMSLLAAAIRAAVGGSPTPATEPAEGDSGARLTSPAVRLSRLLASQAGAEELSRAIAALETAGSGSALARVLKTELQIETGQLDTLAEALATPEALGDDDVKRDRALLAGLVFELAEKPARARELYQLALTTDPQCEAAARAKIAVSDANARGAILEEFAANVEDPRTTALVLLEAAHGGGDASDAESYSRLLKQSYEKAPSLPFAAWLAERRARARGEFDNIVEWLRERREASEDRVEQAYDLVREALLVADRDIEAARELLEQASLARSSDLALRELYERLSPEAPSDRATFWAERAVAATGPDRARIALFAAFEFERGGNFAEAARLAHVALEAEDNALARLCAERNEARGGLASSVAERLFEHAKATDDEHARIESYERLAELDDVVRNDASSALGWHRTILEQRPGHLPSLARIEQGLIGDGREDELEPVAAELAKALQGPEAAAHAHLATRLRTRIGPWQGGAEFVKVAYSQPEPPLWAVREMEAHAALANDAATELAVARVLMEQTTRPLEVATLCLRAADAAQRTGDTAAAKEFLGKAAQLYPAHIMVHRAMADLCERAGDHAAAAEAWEAVAMLSTVTPHKLDASHKAATIWLDQVKDGARGRAALETAAQIDVTYKDVFTRLQGIYVAAADREALASLLESRLASVQDPEERIELEVVRGRTLAEIGDSDAAKRALSFALEASPDHPDALAAFADLSLAEEDWTGAEQALIRLVRLVPDTAKQAAIYTRLGELYDERLPNPERAELAYREVLRRIPGDAAAQERLVEVYRRTGDSPKAIEIQHALLSAAKSPEQKRKRTVELAAIHEQVARDPKKAEALLEAARKEFPNDVELLAAVAAFYTRSNRVPALHVLLDRAAGDARRALATGRFDVSLFAMLGAVAKLRDRTQAARIAETTVAAIEGRPSELGGAEGRAADARLDDLLAPELLTPAFRALLNKSGEILDAASPVDLKGLRAAPLSQPLTAAGIEVKELGNAFGIAGLEVFVSPTLGSVCMPVGSHPPQIVIGQSLMTSGDDGVRRFLVRRALKAIQARASALSRSAPIDLLPLISAYLLLFAPDWQPSAVDPGKLRDVHTRLLRAKPKRLDDDVGMLALEVIGSLGNRASTLHTIVNGWGNRVAMLACGDLSVAFTSIARAAGHTTGPAPSGPERVTWINRNAEARDLAVFSVSDAYAEVRTRLGI